MGETRAAEWILTGRTYSGTEAAAAGFATRAVPSASLELETRKLVEGLLSRGAAALDAARDVLRQSRREALATHLAHAEDLYRRLEGDPDLANAVQGFQVKRPLSS
jgi:enoyl-CoA hydratase/carnithine racemase